MKNILPAILVLLFGYSSFAQCNPTFTAVNSPNGNNFLAVVFTNTTNYTPPNGYSVQYSMNFGDGYTNNDISNNFLYNYSVPGVYNVVMTMSVLDSFGTYCTSTTSQSVDVEYTPCESTIIGTLISQNNTQEEINLTANNIMGTPGMTYSWDFGDGFTGTGVSTTHTYTTNNIYTVTLTATGGGCTYVNTILAHIAGIIDCNALSCSISNTVNYSSVYFTDNYTITGNGQGVKAFWDFGDGHTSTNLNPTHIYLIAGTYTVNLTTTWVDSVFNGGGVDTLCTTSSTTTVTAISAPPAPNRISGRITFNNVQPNPPTCKVWLITYDPNTNLLLAIDSTTSTLIGGDTAYYEFNNEINNIYRVKANLINNGLPGQSGYIPTYSNSSLNWNTAHTVNYGGGWQNNMNIDMQYGIVPSGPGFIGGNVLGGANKNTGGGAPVNGMLVYLRNANGNIITYTYTDANGNYSFSNIANGTYSIYPEAINYATTPVTNIVVNGQVNNIGFYQHISSMTITPYTEAVNNVTNNNSVNIYPNPSDGNITLQWNQAKTQAATVVVTDEIGRQVYATSINMTAGNGAKAIDLNTLCNGLYIINIKSAEGSYSQKLSIEK